MKRIFACTVVSFILSGCVTGYSIKPARLILTNVDNLSISGLRTVIGPQLRAEQFEDLGLDEEMIALLSRSGSDEPTGSGLVDLFKNQYTYLSERRNLRIVVIDYTDIAARRPTLPYEEPLGPFFEISVYEERPGGFSSSGSEFLARLHRDLEKSLSVPVTLVTPPPETNDREYWRISITNYTVAVVNWVVVLGISLAITGPVSFYIINNIPVPVRIKRGIFILVNTWLVAPLPFPAATIFIIMLPSLLAFPWTSIDYYQRVVDYAIVSFPITLVLCTLMSLKIFRHPDIREHRA